MISIPQGIDNVRLFSARPDVLCPWATARSAHAPWCGVCKFFFKKSHFALFCFCHKFDLGTWKTDTYGYLLRLNTWDPGNIGK